MGPVLPQEIQEKLSHLEEEYFKKHSASLKSYMSKIDLDLAVVSSPHKPSFIIHFTPFSAEGFFLIEDVVAQNCIFFQATIYRVGLFLFSHVPIS